MVDYKVYAYVFLKKTKSYWSKMYYEKVSKILSDYELLKQNILKCLKWPSIQWSLIKRIKQYINISNTCCVILMGLYEMHNLIHFISTL